MKKKDIEPVYLVFKISLTLIVWSIMLFAPVMVFAEPAPWYGSFDDEWGGHTTYRGSVSWPSGDSYFSLVGLEPFYDGSIELRLKNTLYWGDRASLQIDYEQIARGGDTRRRQKQLAGLDPGLQDLEANVINDDRRLFDLTGTLDESSDTFWYHRLDRLALTFLPDWGTLRIGRQAMTWGNGLLFNTMDLFNPFAPTDIEREYKIGDDMISTQFYLDTTGIQLLLVPRRDPQHHDLAWDQSSLAGKVHLSSAQREYDLLLASHYDDIVLGAGTVGYLDQAVWRIDSTLTFLQNEDAEKDAFVAATANIDYSWRWRQKNMYGFLEFYYNSLPDGDYTEALLDESIVNRLERGELFTLGNAYLAGHLRLEIHPLLNAFITVITNITDSSGILQPRMMWDVTGNLQLTCGGNFYYGGDGSEYGGFRIPQTDIYHQAPQKLFVWGSYYF